MPLLYLLKSESYVHFVHPLEDAKQYSNPIASLTLSVASAKTTSYYSLSCSRKFVNLTDKSRSDKGYHSVPPPLSGNFIPCKPDLTFIDEIVESEILDVTTVVTPCNDKTDENKGVSNTVKSNAVRMNNSSAPIIEDWNSDDESEVEPNDKTVRSSTEKIKSIKTVRETDVPKQNKHHPTGNQRN
ncbi:hypothetical protein Tco_1215632 [Tanacetum coccineum]